MTAIDVPPTSVRCNQSTAVGPYDDLAPPERYIHRTRDDALLALLRRHGIETLAGRSILELGCGSGTFLRSLIAYGANAERLMGIDPDFRRLRRARNARDARVAVADGALLPYKSETFDLVFIFTAFSSMTDPEVRRHAAHEALRVLRPGGLVVVYDFWTNPFNSRVLPVSPSELTHIFEPHRVEIEHVTLAPPLVRLLAGRESLCRPLERLPFLRTHLLAAVTNEQSDG